MCQFTVCMCIYGEEMCTCVCVHFSLYPVERPDLAGKGPTSPDNYPVGGHYKRFQFNNGN